MIDRIPRRSRRLGLRRQNAAAAPVADPVVVASKVASTEKNVAPMATKPLHQNKTPPSPPLPTLNPKQRLFVEYYLMSHNATDAAKKAGYSKKTARQQGSDLLSHPYIAAAISKKTERTIEKLEISRERIQQELARMGLANMQDFMSVNADGAPVTDFSALTRDQAAALQEITVEEFTDGRSDKREVRRVKFKLADKTNALMALGKDLGMFKETVQHDHRHTLVGVLLEEIDQAGRGAKLIDQMPQGKDDAA